MVFPIGVTLVSDGAGISMNVRSAGAREWLRQRHGFRNAFWICGAVR